MVTYVPASMQLQFYNNFYLFFSWVVAMVFRPTRTRVEKLRNSHRKKRSIVWRLSVEASYSGGKISMDVFVRLWFTVIIIMPVWKRAELPEADLFQHKKDTVSIRSLCGVPDGASNTSSDLALGGVKRLSGDGCIFRNFGESSGGKKEKTHYAAKLTFLNDIPVWILYIDINNGLWVKLMNSARRVGAVSTLTLAVSRQIY